MADYGYIEMSNKKLVDDSVLGLLHYGYRVMSGSQEFVAYPANSTIRVWFSAAPDHYDAHWHSAVEVLLPIEGECLMTVGDREYTVKAGEVMIVPSNISHSLTMKENSKRDLVLFELNSILTLRDFSVLKTMLTIPIHLTESSPIRERARELLYEIISEYHSANMLKNMLSYARILELYTLIGRDYLNGIYSSQNISQDKQRAYWEVLDRVISYVDRYYMEQINLDTISAYVGFSKYHFSRLFRQYTGLTFCSFLINKRVIMAEQMLDASALPVSEIALQCGFVSISTFNRIYKQYRGCTPSQYRSLRQSQRRQPPTAQ